MSGLPHPESQKQESKNPNGSIDNSSSRTPRSSSRYQFANNPAMSRTWIRNLLFGFAIAMPISMVGLEAQWWQAKDLLLIYGIVVATCLILLPIYTAIVRELP